MKQTSLKWTQLYRTCSVEEIPYDSTDQADGLSQTGLGQERALEAIAFGIGMPHRHYNLYLLGSTGLGKHQALVDVLNTEAQQHPTPSDWCYVNNFEQSSKPQVLELPAGKARGLANTMDQFMEDLLIGLPAAFESQEYRTQLSSINESIEEQQETAFMELNEKANKENVGLIRTPSGYTLVPLVNKRPMDQEAYEKISEELKDKYEEAIEKLKDELKQIILTLPALRKEGMAQVKALNQSYTESTVAQFIQPIFDTYADLPQVIAYLEKVKLDIINHFEAFLPNQQQVRTVASDPGNWPPEIKKYRINLLVDRTDSQGAPVVYEDNPNYNKLIGRIEHISELGSLTTNFTLIKPGALHQANGGYLILDAEKLLTKPYAWDALKRVLRADEIKIESMEQMLSLVTTISLEPETIPIKVKVILIGSRQLYYLLKMYDPDFIELFKTTVDFAETMDRNEESNAAYANLVAGLYQEAATLPIDRSGVARIIEHSSRAVDDAEKLSLHMGQLRELILESDYWANKNSRKMITSVDVQQAIDSRIRRADQIRERAHEQILRGIKLIDTEGGIIGQINGLAVMQLGDFSFGQPSRISATARLGTGRLIDIERETKMGGPIHSKAVMILSSCLAQRYAAERPLSLSATLVFEQNYGGIEGDSASLAEFIVLLSAIIQQPVLQNWAITGSMNQHGQAQAIGGVNEKIEGFYDICCERGLDRQQGVIIPSANIKHLMLRRDVIEAVKNEQFHIHAVTHVDEAIEILFDLPAGEKDADNNYPEGSVNRMVVDRLIELHRCGQSFKQPLSDETNGESDEDEETQEDT